MKIEEGALKQFKLMMGVEKQDSIRIFIVPSCCSPVVMIDAEKGKKGDKLVKQDGINIYVDAEAYETLSDAIIDCINGQFKISGLSQSGSSCCG